MGRTAPGEARARQGLVSLAKAAETLQSAAEDAFASRDLMKPLVHERESLKQELSALNGQLSQDTGEPRKSTEYREILRTSQRITKRIAECNREIDVAVKPFNEFADGVSSFIGRLQSALRLLPSSPETKRNRNEIEELPLVTRGLGRNWVDTRDDLQAIQMRLSEFLAESTEGNRSFRITVPPSTKWENIHIRFLSPETIEVQTGNPRQHFNFAELGFEDRRKRSPNTAWVLLRELAKNGEIRIEGKDPVVVEKAIQALRKRLKNLFKLDDDPFHPFRESRCYRSRFKMSSLPLD